MIKPRSISVVSLKIIRGNQGQNSGGGRFSPRSQISRRRYRISRPKANQPLQREASRDQSELESAVDSRISCYRNTLER